MPRALTPEAARTAVLSEFELIRADLENLVRIPSVSADGFDPAEVQRSAEYAADWLERSGLQGVRLLEVDGAHPAVFGVTPGPPGSPSVLLYAHHDVQPAGVDELWTSHPFEPVERDGRLFGRGTSDDKAGIAVHAAALRAWEGRPPVTVAAFIEGEEEIGSAHLADYLAKYGDLLKADAIVLADCANWTIGQPALTTSLRGIIDCIVEVRTLDHAVHSGMYGGPVPDALTTLCKLIATLHDRKGNVAVRNLRTSPTQGLALAESELRRVVGLRPGVRLLGNGPLTHRLWTRPAIAVLGIDAPSTTESGHKLVPIARAKISVRLAPDDDTRRAFLAVAEHLHTRAPWGAEVKVELSTEGEPHRVDASGHAFEAFRQACLHTWGRLPVEPGTGGSLPLVSALAAAYPDTALLLTGVEDPDSKAHAENESVHLDELVRCCVSETLFLSHLAGPA
ncbi:MAG TPA: M20/M25/M40 family metallo-hydrolase [Streptosporangiaceae bacterium]|nr:M20/M25/M40 family metallo-hydrolase [Streptosporangiaceae bacterium]